MSVLSSTQPVTADQLWAMPDDGKERWLINGELREEEMTRRTRGHSRVESRIAHLLWMWLESQPEPRGEVLSGEAGLRLRRNPDTLVGIDVAYVSAETLAQNPHDERYIDGVPMLAVEILSPSDKQDKITDKVRSYLQAGTPLVWVVDPGFETITVYRPDAAPQLFNVTQTLSADPHLPGFSVAVAEVFAR